MAKLAACGVQPISFTGSQRAQTSRMGVAIQYHQLRTWRRPLPACGRWTGEGAGPRARAPAPLPGAFCLLLVAGVAMRHRTGSASAGTTIHRTSQSASLNTFNTVAGFTGLRKVIVRYEAILNAGRLLKLDHRASAQ